MSNPDEPDVSSRVVSDVAFYLPEIGWDDHEHVRVPEDMDARDVYKSLSPTKGAVDNTKVAIEWLVADREWSEYERSSAHEHLTRALRELNKAESMLSAEYQGRYREETDDE